MTVVKPSYYDSFRCIAGACPDSCCKEWAVQVDEEAAAYYRKLPGSLGDRLRQVLREEDGETVMTIADGRCPMWRQDGLCRIQAELGEAALCQVCREFPRLKHDYGDYVELGLELSCPEAARIILNGAREPGLTADTADEDLQLLLDTRQRALALLELELPMEKRLALVLLYGYEAQALLDGAAETPFSPASALEAGEALAKEPDEAGFFGFFDTLEQLTDQWAELRHGARLGPLPEKTEALARYLLNRYWLQAISDFDLICRVKLIVVSCLLVAALPGEFEANAQLFSKEIENDADNVDALLDAAYTEAAFTDERLLGALLIHQAETRPER